MRGTRASLPATTPARTLPVVQSTPSVEVASPSNPIVAAPTLAESNARSLIVENSKAPSLAINPSPPVVASKPKAPMSKKRAGRIPDSDEEDDQLNDAAASGASESKQPAKKKLKKDAGDQMAPAQKPPQKITLKMTSQPKKSPTSQLTPSTSAVPMDVDPVDPVRQPASAPSPSLSVAQSATLPALASASTALPRKETAKRQGKPINQQHPMPKPSTSSKPISARPTTATKPIASTSKLPPSSSTAKLPPTSKPISTALNVKPKIPASSNSRETNMNDLNSIATLFNVSKDQIPLPRPSQVISPIPPVSAPPSQAGSTNPTPMSTAMRDGRSDQGAGTPNAEVPKKKAPGLFSGLSSFKVYCFLRCRPHLVLMYLLMIAEEGEGPNWYT